MVGTNEEDVYTNASELLSDAKKHKAMIRTPTPSAMAKPASASAIICLAAGGNTWKVLS